jgi:hypothetical protein
MTGMDVAETEARTVVADEKALEEGTDLEEDSPPILTLVKQKLYQLQLWLWLWFWFKL